MKTAITIILMVTLASLSGCKSSSPRGGSVLKGEGFKIAVPTFPTEIKQGEVQIVTITLERGDYFNQDVKLQIEAAQGIRVDPSYIKVVASDKPEVQVRVIAGKEAAISEYRVSVIGIPETGEPASTEFKVKVVAP